MNKFFLLKKYLTIQKIFEIIEKIDEGYKTNNHTC